MKDIIYRTLDIKTNYIEIDSTYIDAFDVNAQFRMGKLTCTRFAQETTTLVPRHSANGAHLVPVVSDYKGTILNMNFDHLKETCIRPCA